MAFAASLPGRSAGLTGNGKLVILASPPGTAFVFALVFLPETKDRTVETMR